MAIIIHRNDKSNAGDYWSRPSHYFPIVEDEVLDIQDLDPFVTDKTIIIGGGGLLGRPKWTDTIKEISYKNKVILWGAGHNMYVNKRLSYKVCETVESSLPTFIDNFQKVGLRDYNQGYTWVPCSSCMHTAFDKAYKIKKTKDTIGIRHKKMKIRTDLFDVISHVENYDDLENFLCHIAQYKNVVTNTYHGAYWAMLLGCKVLVQPWSSKFNDMKFNHKKIKNDVSNFRQDLEGVIPSKDALVEARDANVKFFTSCEDLI